MEVLAGMRERGVKIREVPGNAGWLATPLLTLHIICPSLLQIFNTIPISVKILRTFRVRLRSSMHCRKDSLFVCSSTSRHWLDSMTSSVTSCNNHCHRHHFHCSGHHHHHHHHHHHDLQVVKQTGRELQRMRAYSVLCNV